MTIEFHSKAREEFFKAANYYEDQVVGLGDIFIDEVEHVLEVIEQYPSSGAKISTTERRFLVSRFPYGIVYTIEDDLIKILAIMNLRQKPGYWESRT